jgi:asparagine synthetase B (glutamine-hydrolysing)
MVGVERDMGEAGCLPAAATEAAHVGPSLDTKEKLAVKLAATLPAPLPAAAAASDEGPTSPLLLYCSAAPVVLLGHGADEQAGGYGRHRTKFRAHGWQGLVQELQVDMQRLWFRNLGRDDRLIADHGRESRHPFLDEQLVELLLMLPLEEVVDLRESPGEGKGRRGGD